MTVSEVMKILDLSQNYINSLILDGKLRATKIFTGGRGCSSKGVWEIAKEDLEDYQHRKMERLKIKQLKEAERLQLENIRQTNLSLGLTLQQVSDRLGISRQRVQQLVQEGRLQNSGKVPYVGSRKPGYLITESSLASFLQNREIQVQLKVNTYTRVRTRVRASDTARSIRKAERVEVMAVRDILRAKRTEVKEAKVSGAMPNPAWKIWHTNHIRAKRLYKEAILSNDQETASKMSERIMILDLNKPNEFLFLEIKKAEQDSTPPSL